MGYDGGFTKIKKKLNTQKELNLYELKDRYNLYKEMGDDKFYEFEGSAVDLAFLDNNWIQVKCLKKVMADKKINNYEVDKTHYTLITKDILNEYILEVKNWIENYIVEHGIIEKKAYYWNDILLLEKLYKDFDWDNNTLVFSYSY